MADCANCGQPLREGASFCAQCGAAVKRCPNCGQPLKADAMFCAQCGAPLGESSPAPSVGASPSAWQPGPAATQPEAATARIRFVVHKPIYGGLMTALESMTNTILVDGYPLGTVQFGETMEFGVAAGRHAIQLVHSYKNLSTLNMPITRTSNTLEVTVEAGIVPIVNCEYSALTWNFDLSVQ